MRIESYEAEERRESHPVRKVWHTPQLLEFDPRDAQLSSSGRSDGNGVSNS